MKNNMNFATLAKARERMEDSSDGQFGRCGNWKVALGGYDMGYEVYFKGTPVARVNYEIGEFELYNPGDDGYIGTDDIKAFLQAMDARKFVDVTEYDDEAFESTKRRHTMKKTMAKEARLPVMWAIDFRDYHTAIHGLIYAKDRKVVEQFYERLSAIFDEEDPDLQEMDYQQLWDEFSGKVQQIDEIDYRDIGKLPSGKYGIIIDGVEYRIVNQPWIDLYEESRKGVKESTRKTMKKIVKESSELEQFLIKKEKEFKPSRVNPSWDESEDKIWAVQEYLSQMGEFTDEDREFLKHTDPEMLSLEDEPMEESKKVVDEAEGEEFSVGDQVIWQDNVWEVVDSRFDKIVEHYCYDLVEPESGEEAFDIAESELCAYDGGVYESKKPAKESTADDDGTPKIYVGTYAKYNDGSIDGKWVDLTAFDTYDEFVDYCRSLHKDEKDPEFMVQDFENYPKKWYHEGGLPTEEEFDKIVEFYQMDDSRKEAYEAFVNYTGDDDIEKFQESYECEYTSDSDFGYYLIDEFGFEGIQNLDYYFDYDAFGRDLMMDYNMGEEGETDADGEPQDPDHYYDQDGYDMGEYESDKKVAEDFVDNMGGVEALGKETCQNYFDYEAFGRDCLINDFFVSDGYVFRNY